MILIEDTHWPLVVVGLYDGPLVHPDVQQAARVRWWSSEPRLVVLVVPGSANEALDGFQQLRRWCRFHVTDATPCWGVAWVVPDQSVRASVEMLLACEDHVACGSPSAAFRTVAAAFSWIIDVGRSVAYALSLRRTS